MGLQFETSSQRHNTNIAANDIVAGPISVADGDAGVGVAFTRNGVEQGIPFVDLRGGGGSTEEGGWWRVAASMRCDGDTVGNRIRLDPSVATPMDIVNCAKVSILCSWYDLLCVLLLEWNMSNVELH